MPNVVLAMLLSSSGLLAALIALAGKQTYGLANGLATAAFVLMTVFVIVHARNIYKTKAVAFLLVIAGTVFWYLYANAAAALFVPDRCLGWTSCFSPNEITVTFAHVCVFLTSFALLYALVADRASIERTGDDSESIVPDYASFDRIAVAAIIVGLIPILVSGLSPKEVLLSALSGRAVEKVWMPMANLGDESSAYYWAARMMLVTGLTISFARLLTSTNSIGNRSAHFLFWLMPFTFLFFDSGTRYLTLSIVLPGLILKLLLMRRPIPLAPAAIAIATLVSLSQLQLFSRDDSAQLPNDELANFETATLFGSTDFYHETANAQRLRDQLKYPLLDNDLVIFTTFALPRSVWPNKPIPQVVREYTTFRWGIDIITEVGNVFPGLLGQYLLSLGALGPLAIGLVLGVIAAILDNRLIRHRVLDLRHSLPLISYSVALFLSFRYLSPGYFVVPVLVHLTAISTRSGVTR